MVNPQKTAELLGFGWESVLLLVLVVVALFGTAASPSRLSRLWRRVAARHGLAIAVIGGLSLLASTLLELVHPAVPKIHDEFSYLLQADTFAQARLANPPHALWEHFESFHINQQPTYASKYPPAQGAFLALGQVLTGRPLIGVWISLALACAAVCWMLQGWVPARDAFLGGWLTVFHAHILWQWGHTYWGGAVPMLGGALLFGGLRRIARQPRAIDALLLAAGLALLAMSRPFEGLIASLPAAAVLLAQLACARGPRLIALLNRVAAPIGIVLAVTCLGMAAYNAAVTGDPLQMPYEVHIRAYDAAPLFLWQDHRRMPDYRHAILAKAHREWDELASDLQSQRRTQGIGARYLKIRAGVLSQFLIGPLLILPFLMLPFVLRNQWMRFAAATCSLLLLCLTQTTWFQPHYAAPIVPLVMALIVQGLRRMRFWTWRGRACGRRYVELLPAFSLVACLISTAAFSTVVSDGWAAVRAQIGDDFCRAGGQHVILVRYGEKHHPGCEWVYNSADLDHSPVIWARDRGAAKNRRLLDYYADRQIWLLEADTRHPAPVHYSDVIITSSATD